MSVQRLSLYLPEPRRPHRLKAGVVARQWAAYLSATNLTNKRAALTIDNTVFAWQQPTITRVSTNQPRAIGIAVTCKF